MSSTAKPLTDYKKNIQNGVWFMLHTMAEAAQTPELMRAYAFNFRNICDKMGCSCENHCKEMLQNHPPEAYFSHVDPEGIPNGCLQHSIICHNEVNMRLGKPTYSYDQIAPLYRPREKILKACESPDIKVESRQETVVRPNLSINELAKMYPEVIKPKKTFQVTRLGQSNSSKVK